MARQHIWRIKKEYFRQLKSGEKKLEIRIGYPWVKNVQQGDTITFENYGPNKFDVKRVTVYDDFAKMLEAEGVERIFPGMAFEEGLRTIREIYPPNKESLGVYVLELKFVRP